MLTRLYTDNLLNVQVTPYVPNISDVSVYAGYCLIVEGVCMDSVKADVDLIQTEWDVCSRELQAASERVCTQSRVNTLSAELADLDRSLGQQDHWIESNSAIWKCNDETELRRQIRECEVRLLSLVRTDICSLKFLKWPKNVYA